MYDSSDYPDLLASCLPGRTAIALGRHMTLSPAKEAEVVQISPAYRRESPRPNGGMNGLYRSGAMQHVLRTLNYHNFCQVRARSVSVDNKNFSVACDDRPSHRSHINQS